LTDKNHFELLTELETIFFKIW